MSKVRRFPLFGFVDARSLWLHLHEHGGGVSLSTCRNWARGRIRPASEALHQVCEALRLTTAERVQLIADLAPGARHVD